MLADDILEPWGENRGDIHAAQVTSAIYNASRTRRGQKCFQISDTLVQWNVGKPENASKRERDAGNAKLFAILSKYAKKVEG